MYKGINFIYFKSYSVTKSPHKKKNRHKRVTHNDYTADAEFILPLLHKFVFLLRAQLNRTWQRHDNIICQSLHVNSRISVAKWQKSLTVTSFWSSDGLNRDRLRFAVFLWCEKQSLIYTHRQRQKHSGISDVWPCRFELALYNNRLLRIVMKGWVRIFSLNMVQRLRGLHTQRGSTKLSFSFLLG